MKDPNPNNLVACATLYTETMPPLLLLVRAAAVLVGARCWGTGHVIKEPGCAITLCIVI